MIQINMQSNCLLTIVVPTFNRAGKVCKQIQDICSQIEQLEKGFADAIEVLVLDNCSDDGTQESLAELRNRFSFRYCRNFQNLGLVGNYIKCFYSAHGRYVWVVGDDDLLEKQAVQHVMLAVVRGDAGVLAVAYKKLNGITKEVTACDFKEMSEGNTYGVEELERLLSTSGYGNWLWLTGCVLRRDLAIEVINGRESCYNLAYPLYLGVSCAIEGGWSITPGPVAVMVTHDNSWQAVARRVYAIDIPIVLRCLSQRGLVAGNVPAFQLLLRRRWRFLAADLWRRKIECISDFYRLQLEYSQWF